MSYPTPTHYHYYNHIPPKLHHHHFHYFTFYYQIIDNTYHPIAISKPNSTQLPHYYLITQPTFPTLQQLLNHYTNPSNIPLK